MDRRSKGLGIPSFNHTVMTTLIIRPKVLKPKDFFLVRGELKIERNRGEMLELVRGR